MLRCFRVRCWLSAEVKINSKDFSFAEVKSMCGILNMPYRPFNEQIDIYEDIKLLDDNNKIIGVYKPEEAKKKVAQLKRDMVLFNASSKPIICKALNYRHDIVTKFYTDLVLKKKQALVKANENLKGIKLNPNLTDNELKIKANQIIELTKKNAQVRIFIRSRRVLDEEKVQAKLQSLRNMIHNKVKIKKDVNEVRKIEIEDAEVDEESEQEEKFYSGADRRKKSWDIIVESLKGEFQNKLDKSVKQHPEESIRKFLQGFEDEEQQDMIQLKYDIRKAKYDARNDVEEGEETMLESENFTKERLLEQMIKELQETRKKQFSLMSDLKLRDRLAQLTNKEKL